MESRSPCARSADVRGIIACLATRSVALSIAARGIILSRMRLVLASASPRRRALLHLFGLSFDIVAADVDEDSAETADAAESARVIALLKAQTVAATTPDGALVIGSDTHVAVDGVSLGKPRDSADARAMLRLLRGRVHQVHTGIAVIDTTTSATWTDVATIDVPMRNYSDAEIDAYIAGGDPFDKAGGYGIQHPDFQPVARLHGCFAGVMGLPLCHLARILRRCGVTWPADIAATCQMYNQFECPVFESILSSA